jgi:hypothetical protein
MLPARDTRLSEMKGSAAAIGGWRHPAVFGPITHWSACSYGTEAMEAGVHFNPVQPVTE